MSSTFSNTAAPVASRSDIRQAPEPAPAKSASPAPTPPGPAGSPNGERFAALLHAFRDSGGTARGDDLGQLFEQHLRGDYVSLAKLLVARRVFGFKWRQTLWIPMFQFDAQDLSVKPAGQRVIDELGSAFDGWRLAEWFADANAWLGGRRPVDALDAHLPEVLDAARHDRASLGRTASSTHTVPPNASEAARRG